MSRSHHSTPKVPTGPSSTKRTEQRRVTRSQRQKIRQEVRAIQQGADPDAYIRRPRLPKDIVQNFFW